LGLGSAAASTRPGHVDVDGASWARLPGARGKRPRTGLGLLTRAATLVLTLWPALAVAGDVALLPDVTAHLEGAYYVPSEQAFVWDTWVGAGAGLVRVKRSTFYLTADLETILGRERRPFDANLRAGRLHRITFFWTFQPAELTTNLHGRNAPSTSTGETGGEVREVRDRCRPRTRKC
jgi:hypothetical protein